MKIGSERKRGDLVKLILHWTRLATVERGSTQFNCFCPAFEFYRHVSPSKYFGTQSLVEYSNHFPFGYLHPPTLCCQITSFLPSLHWKVWECNLTKSRFTQRIVQILRKNSSVEKDGCGWVGAAYCVTGWSLWGPWGPAEAFQTICDKSFIE